MKKILRWLPATLLMAGIFLFSGTPSASLPSYGGWDALIKKSGHVSGYALLALAYWFGLTGSGVKKNHFWQAWALALLYALSDEFHQSYTPGRHPALTDVFLFDGGGATLACLFLWWKTRKRGTVEKKETGDLSPRNNNG